MSATHFITAPTFHRKRLFQNQKYGDLLTETLLSFRESYPVQIHDYVIMPDHVHVLLTIYGDLPANDAMQKLQRHFAEQVAQQFGYNGEVWETSFHNDQVNNAEDCARCVKKIHSNPVRVGFCDKPGEYRMSSKASRWVLDPLPENLRELYPA
ncbi:protein of unknown function DUF1568 [Candidatus Koribacter versatilis Ellin345]|uniref:Transposase IS200-like domain-containing protein n=1 Tax=Koribacter versatilis (strain Ellin345) TaxID=204669 RepID=Q1II38_KORVE|nr:transposase [Candidatus Koribacter versatilis]ABF43462.1 protein of unknown function DUF1568 [Candidatus Koribacter versatilis Ellin345]